MEKIDKTQKIIIPKTWKNKSQDLLDTLKKISNEDINSISEEMNTKKKEKELEKKRIEEEKKELEEKWKRGDKQKDQESKFNRLKWNFFAVLDDMKFQHTKKFESRISWLDWDSVYINFPAVWKFPWYKFSYFVSDWQALKFTVWDDPKIECYLYRIKDIAEILNIIREYLKEYWVYIDRDIDYESGLKPWKDSLDDCVAWKFLKQLTWLDKTYWLKDDNVWRFKKSRAYLDCTDRSFNTDCYYLDWTYAHVLLKK